MFKTAALIALAAVCIGIGTKYYQLQSVPNLPELDLERWWGAGDKPKQEDVSIRPFKVVFNDTVSNLQRC